MKLSILYFKGLSATISITRCVSVPEDSFHHSQTVGQTEQILMKCHQPSYAAFHQGLHCLPMCLPVSITKRVKTTRGHRNEVRPRVAISINSFTEIAILHPPSQGPTYQGNSYHKSGITHQALRTTETFTHILYTFNTLAISRNVHSLVCGFVIRFLECTVANLATCKFSIS